MEKHISRRSLLKKSVIALGTAAVCDLKGISNAEQVKGSKTFSGEALKEEIDPQVRRRIGFSRYRRNQT